jgi:sugar-specific transcriptional regulator TrmB
LDFSKADLQTFSRLGLSNLQTKVYLTLIRSTNATIKEISTLSGIARQDIYRLTKELMEKGLVKKELTIPNKFEAVPLDDGINILQKEIEKEAIETRKKIHSLIKRYEHKPNLKNVIGKEFNLSVIPQKDAILFTINQIKNAKKSVDLVTSKDKARFIIWTAKDVIKKALLRKVKFRIIFDNPLDQKQLLPKQKSFTKNPLFNIRVVNFTPQTALSIYDNKKTSLMLKPKEKLSKTPLLTSNNSALLEIVRDYFEIKWFTAMEPEKQLSSKT